jgi:hypothetical protein
MVLYGLRGFTHHGWEQTLTVLSPGGRTEALQHMQCTDGLRTVQRPHSLTRYHEIRAGSVQALVKRYSIRLLDRAAWEAKKTELGVTAYR